MFEWKIQNLLSTYHNSISTTTQHVNTTLDVCGFGGQTKIVFILNSAFLFGRAQED